MNIKVWLKKNIKILSDLDNPKHEVEILLCHVLQCDKSFILTHQDIILNSLELNQLHNFIIRRSQGEPISYILGKKEFWSLSLIVSYDTLIPRSDTEILVEQALLKIYNNTFFILDLGSGCGSISLALASSCTNSYIIGVDNSEKALQISRLNAFKLCLKNVSFIYSNWFSHINKKFNIIVSNPPYISVNDMNILQKDIFFEPFSALFSKKNGFADLEHIIQYSRNYLFIGGWLLIEHGWMQKKRVQYFFEKYKFYNIQSYSDYRGYDRVTIGQK